jgi:hypothetical protein
MLYSQVAVVKGAALRGLEGVAPQKKRCKRHYGIDCDFDFREGIDEERHSYINPLTGRKLCRGRAFWLMAKVREASILTDDNVDMIQGEEITKDTSKKFSFSQTYTAKDARTIGVGFFSTPLIQTPERLDHPSMYPVISKMPQFANTNRGQPCWEYCCGRLQSIRYRQMQEQMGMVRDAILVVA